MMKAKRILLAASLAFLVLLTGCRMFSVTNLTPDKVSENPSGIYTLSVRAKPLNDRIQRSSIEVSLFVDGEQKPLEPGELGTFVYDYDYVMPDGRDAARYYYVINYTLKKWDAVQPGPAKVREYTSDLFSLEVEDRYSITLDAERAPVGTRIAILGKGFARSDRVFVGGTPAVTRYVSRNALEFIVPALETDRSYPVEVRHGSQAESAGVLRIDPGLPLSVLPPTIELAVGEQQLMVFAIDFPAPADGLAINVTTDIPDSIVMPQVVIPEGEQTVNVPVEAARAGNGSLYVSLRGGKELVVPVSIR